MNFKKEYTVTLSTPRTFLTLTKVLPAKSKVIAVTDSLDKAEDAVRNYPNTEGFLNISIKLEYKKA